jgi:hypothetical protein
VTDTPETRYTRSADGTNLAYQVSGEGPINLVFMHGTGIPIDLLAEDTGFIRLRRRLDTFSRTVWFESRGMGASEGHPREATTEIGDADLIAVLDAGSHRMFATSSPASRFPPWSCIVRETVSSAWVLAGT